MKPLRSRIPRFALSAGLLFIVWLNSHWSVALLLTLMTAGFEVKLWEDERRFVSIATILEKILDGLGVKRKIGREAVVEALRAQKGPARVQP
jgi:hypothetical protein